MSSVDAEGQNKKILSLITLFTHTFLWYLLMDSRGQIKIDICESLRVQQLGLCSYASVHVSTSFFCVVHAFPLDNVKNKT